MEVLAEQNLDHHKLEQQMDVNAVLLLQEMHGTDDLYKRRRLFEQAADQEMSWISEVLDGSVITDFRFEAQDGKLYLLQPNGVTDWQQMHRHGVTRARARAHEDPQFLPYVDIAKAELQESRFQEAMVLAGKPAVMAKLSLCGSDVMSADRLRKLGRDPDLQRAYLRVSVFDGDNMHIHSRSIDGMNLSDGRGVAKGWGVWENPQIDLAPNASSVDILKNQLYFEQEQMSIEDMHGLADRLVGRFDALQTERTGKLYKNGRCPEAVDTYKFVLSNDDLINAHMGGLADLAARRELPLGHLAALTNDLRYDIMSSFKQRLEGVWTDHGNLADSVAAAGAAEREIGTQYGGCDTVIGTQTAEMAGYVNGQSHEVKAKCVQCPSCKKIVDLPEKLLKKDIMHCVSCKTSVHTKGKKVDQKLIDEFYGIGRDDPDQAESFLDYWERLNMEVKQEQEIKKLQEEAALADAA